MSSRIGTTAGADVLLADIRGKRNRLALSIKAALLELERHPATSYPLARREHRAHEVTALEQALAALLEPAPASEPAQVADREIARSLRRLDAELELVK